MIDDCGLFEVTHYFSLALRSDRSITDFYCKLQARNKYLQKVEYAYQGYKL